MFRCMRVCVYCFWLQSSPGLCNIYVWGKKCCHRVLSDLKTQTIIIIILRLSQYKRTEMLLKKHVTNWIVSDNVMFWVLISTRGCRVRMRAKTVKVAAEVKGRQETTQRWGRGGGRRRRLPGAADAWEAGEKRLCRHCVLVSWQQVDKAGGHKHWHRSLCRWRDKTMEWSSKTKETHSNYECWHALEKGHTQRVCQVGWFNSCRVWCFKSCISDGGLTYTTLVECLMSWLWNTKNYLFIYIYLPKMLLTKAKALTESDWD